MKIRLVCGGLKISKTRALKMRSFFARLIYALGISAFLYIVLTYIDGVTKKSVGSLFADLRPEAIGIVFTVFIVDWLIKTAEARNWTSVKLRAIFRVREVYRKSGTAIRFSGPLHDEILRELYDTSPQLIKKGWEHYDVIQVFIDRYDKLGHSVRWGSANFYYWFAMRQTLQGVMETAEKAIDLYGQYLSPEMQSALDELAGICETGQGHCQILSSITPDATDWGMMDLTYKAIFKSHKKVGELLEKWSLADVGRLD